MFDTLLSFDVLLLLMMVAAIAGFVDVLAGGGGLIVLPALLAAGIPPLQAIATNKVQASAGTLTAIISLYTRGKLRFTEVRYGMLMALVGSGLGALLVQQVDSRWLSWMIPVVLIAVALYFLFAKDLNESSHKQRMSAATHNNLMVPSVGFYDGFFGPGTGSLFCLSGVALRGQGVIEATVHAKAFNFASNVTSMVVFILGGQVIWLVGLVMIVGQVAGAYAGSLMIHRGGAKLIRPLIVLMSMAMTLHFFWKQFA